MTIFGWDASHYDGNLTKAILARAKAEGIEFFSHKIGEGLSNTDTTARAALEAARDAGIEVIGGYYFIHSGSMVAQADRCIALADQYVPWWREFSGWFWQTDAETDTGGHLPSPAEVKAFSDRLAEQSRRTVIVYASHGMYGDRLRGVGHPLWNANYPSSRRDGFRALYPGDSYAGWTAYSGQTPAICQYASSATIAGLTTCDANAFRGSLAELLALIAGPGSPTTDVPEGDDMPLTGADLDNIAHRLLTGRDLPAGNPTESLGSAALSAQNHAASADAKLDQVLTAIQSLPDAIAAALLAKLPPAGGVTPSGDVTVSGTLHVETPTP